MLTTTSASRRALLQRLMVTFVPLLRPFGRKRTIDRPAVLVMLMPPVAEVCSTLITDAALSGCPPWSGSLKRIHPRLQSRSVWQRAPSADGQMLTGALWLTARPLAIARCAVSKCTSVVARCHSIRLLTLGNPMAVPMPMTAITISNWAAVYPLALE
ncbi:hypothetical protein ASF90_11660 [Xanthomonas sp. Leaf148]|nr:hypothetical protein ASF90_11660 [Xanthomonas sp. Leaf148]